MMYTSLCEKYNNENIIIQNFVVNKYSLKSLLFLLEEIILETKIIFNS